MAPPRGESTHPLITDDYLAIETKTTRACPAEAVGIWCVLQQSTVLYRVCLLVQPCAVPVSPVHHPKRSLRVITSAFRSDDLDRQVQA